MFKDESNGKQITEFVRLRAKCYTYDVEGKSTKDSKKCKGIKKGVVKKRLSINDYRRCVYSQESKLLPMNVIRSPVSMNCTARLLTRLHRVLLVISV